MDELRDTQHNRISSRDERCMYEGSSWTVNSIIKYQLVISEISPCEGSSHFLLPKE